MTPRRAVRTAVLLWLVCAATVWNVVFDRMVVLAGRRYSHDAVVHYRTTGRYLLIDDVMPSAVSRAASVATAVAAGIAIVALATIRVAAARDARRRSTATSGTGLRP